jgi:hypothetical protein
MINRKDDDSVRIGSEELSALRESMKDSEAQLSHFRKNTKLLYKQLSGKWYGSGGPAVPVNLIELLDDVLMRNLITSTPRMSIRARKRELTPSASRLRIAVNNRADRIHLGEELQSCAKSATYGAGLVRVDTEPAIVNIGGERRLHSSPYVARFSADDFRIDPYATTWNEAEYIAQRTFVDWEQLKRSKRYKVPSEVKPDEDWLRNRDRASDISQGSGGRARPYRKKIGLWTVWLPRKSAVLTLADEFETAILRSEKWTGPVEGPFMMLGFKTVPDQLMPLAPMAALVDLHIAANTLFSKIIRACKNSKTLFSATPGSTDDANRVFTASDGSIVPMMDPTAVREMRYGGPDQQIIAMFILVKELFSWFSGNLDLMGGLGPQSPTATQDQMLMSSASKRIAAMQQQMRTFAARILRHLAWYEWNDKLLYTIGKRDVPGLGERTIEITAADFANAGDFFDYEFDVEANSLIRKTPAERAQLAIQFATQILIPLAPMMQESGQGIDFNALVRLFADNQDVPELMDLLKSEITSPGQEKESSGERPTKPNNTERRYVRTTNRSGDTPTSGANAVMAALSGRGGANNKGGA